VYNVFERSFNINTQSNELIGVVRRDVSSGPLNIITDLPLDSNFILLGVFVFNPGQLSGG
jgi:hypothetical protein